MLLLAFGSRARGDAVSHSDWDFGYLVDEGLDVAKLVGTLVSIVGTGRVDLVDLQRASGLLRFRAARDGRPTDLRVFLARLRDHAPAGYAGCG